MPKLLKGWNKWKFWKIAPLVGDTLTRAISLLKEIVIALDTIFHERKDQKAKGIREQLLAPTLIMTLLLLAEVLFLMKHFWTFLQTHNLNYGLIIGRFERLFSILEKVGEFFPHHESLERTLKYSKAKELLLFAKESSKLSRLKQVCN